MQSKTFWMSKYLAQKIWTSKINFNFLLGVQKKSWTSKVIFTFGRPKKSWTSKIIFCFKPVLKPANLLQNLFWRAFSENCNFPMKLSNVISYSIETGLFMTAVFWTSLGNSRFFWQPFFDRSFFWQPFFGQELFLTAVFSNFQFQKLGSKIKDYCITQSAWELWVRLGLGFCNNLLFFPPTFGIWNLKCEIWKIKIWELFNGGSEIKICIIQFAQDLQAPSNHGADRSSTLH